MLYPAQNVFTPSEKEKDIPHKMPDGQTFLFYFDGVVKKETIDLKHFIQELKTLAAAKVNE